MTATALDELLPCPFCGVVPVIKERAAMNGIVCPETSACRGSGLLIAFKPENRTAAIKQWNTRAAQRPAAPVECKHQWEPRTSLVVNSRTWQCGKCGVYSGGAEPASDPQPSHLNTAQPGRIAAPQEGWSIGQAVKRAKELGSRYMTLRTDDIAALEVVAVDLREGLHKAANCLDAVAISLQELHKDGSSSASAAKVRSWAADARKVIDDALARLDGAQTEERKG